MNNKAILIDLERDSMKRAFACARDCMERGRNFQAINHRGIAAQWFDAADSAHKMARLCIRQLSKLQG
jgi:hypothetical protein